jgi:hypothetical protein
MIADKKRACLMVTNPALAHQCFQCFGETVRDWHDPLLATLASQKHLRSRAIQLDIAGIDGERFGNTRASTCQEQQQCLIAAAAWRALVRRADENIKFVSREMMRDLGVRFFYRDGQDALRDAE